MIAAARLRAENVATRIQLVEGDAESPPFGDATFDVVMAVTVFCFVQDTEHAVTEIARVLKPEGRLAVGELGRWILGSKGSTCHGPNGAAACRSIAVKREFLAQFLELTSKARIPGAVDTPHPWDTVQRFRFSTFRRA